MENRLYRIKNNHSMLAGVSQGLAAYFSIDVVIIRVLFVALFFLTHAHIGLIYLILWAVLPLKNEFGYANTVDETIPNNTTENSYLSNLNLSTMNNNSRQNSMTGGIILIILGSIFAIKEFFDVNLFHYVGKMWPLFLVGLGIWLIVRENNNNSLPPSSNL